MAFDFPSMKLTPIDHMMPICYITFSYSLLLEEPHQAIPILQDSLRRLLKECPFLAGNVTRSGQQEPTANVREVRPPTEDSLREFPILRIAYHENMYISKKTRRSGNPVCYDSLFDASYLPLPLGVATADSSPIIRWQANIMQDGVVIAVCFHHSVLDSAGFFAIQQTLAKYCHVPNEPLECHSLQSDLLEGRQRMLQSVRARTDNRAAPTGNSQPLRVANFYTAERLVSHQLTLDAGNVETLKKTCNIFVRASSNTAKLEKVPTLSSNDVVSALLWLATIRARYGPSAQPVKPQDTSPAHSSLVLITEVREALTPCLPITYMGNAIVQSSTTSPISVVDLWRDTIKEPHLHSPDIGGDINLLTDLASKVHHTRKSVDDAYIKGLIDTKQTSVDWNPRFEQGDVTSTSLRRMAIYGLDFGEVLGRVVEFYNPDSRIDGSVCILPARFDSKMAPWEVRITLKPDVMVRLERDPLLHWTMRYQAAKL